MKNATKHGIYGAIIAVLLLFIWNMKDHILEVEHTSEKFKIQADSLMLEIIKADSISTIYKTVAEEQSLLREEATSARTSLLKERAYLRSQLKKRLQIIKDRPVGTYTIEELETILTNIINQGTY